MTKDLYNHKYFKASRKFQSDSIRVEKISDIIASYKPKTILDVGCGIGFLVRKLQSKGYSVRGVDFSTDLEKDYWKGDASFSVADAKNIPYANSTFDIVYSSDFFEHIPEDEIDQVLSEMKRVGTKVIAFIADDRGTTLTKRQAMYHTTHKPLSWWKNKLPGVDIYSSHD